MSQSKVIQAAKQYRVGRDFEWMLEPGWDSSDPYRFHYVELSLLTLAEKLELEEDFQSGDLDEIVAILDSYV
jgi:hypothetical protein